MEGTVISQRASTLKGVETLLQQTEKQREAVGRSLQDVNTQRDDLLATIEILDQQAAGYHQILERASNPKITDVAEFSVRGSNYAQATRDRY